MALALVLLLAGDAVATPLDPGLRARLRTAAAGEAVPVIVQMAERLDLGPYRGMARREARRALVADLRDLAERAQGPLRAFLARSGVREVRPLWIRNALALSAPPALVEALAAFPGVEELRFDATLQAPVLPLAAPAAPAGWNLETIGAPDLWALLPAVTGAGVVVATFDTGADIHHPDLAPTWRGGAADWFDPYTPSTVPYEGDLSGGHGTAVLGLIVGGEHGGFTLGAAPDARWIAAKIFDDSGTATFSAIHAAFQWALDPDGTPGNGDEPDIVNHSWGLNNAGTCVNEFAPDIDALRSAGIVPVFAAGNSGPASGSSISPGNNPGSLAAGMTDAFDALHPLSGRGPSPCDPPGVPFPELAAPGVAVMTAGLTAGGAIPDSYVYATGTSFSTPHVSGALALLMSAFPDVAPDELEAALFLSADDLGPAGPDDDYGYGRVDVSAAYDLLSGVPKLKVHDPDPPENDRLLHFGSVPPAGRAERVLTVRNAGGGALAVSAVGAGLAPPFAVVSDLCGGETLASGATCTVTVSFAPLDSGDAAATLALETDDPEEPLVALVLSGTGSTTLPPAILLSPPDGASGLGSEVTFQWTPSAAPDGEPVSEALLLSTSPDFTHSTPIAAPAGPASVQVAGFGVLLLFCALRPSRRGARRGPLLAAALAAAVLALLLSCGGGGGGGGGAPVTAASLTVPGLDPGTTYFWRIVSEDGQGGSAESAVRHFTTR